MNRPLCLSVVALGVSSVVTQLVTLREFLTVFAGNELVIGIILGVWLLLTGIGGMLGRGAAGWRGSGLWLVVCQLAVAVLPPLQIAAIRLYKGAFLLPGVVPGATDALLVALAILTPYCLAAGFLLPLVTGIVGRREGSAVGRVYVLDALADIAGGALFSFFLVYFLEPFPTVFFLLALNLCAGTWAALHLGRRLAAATCVAALIAAVVTAFAGDWETITARELYPGLNLAERIVTPYGTLDVLRDGGETTVLENGVPAGATGNPAGAEEIVHYAMAQVAEPKTVLLVSGGIAGAAEEAAKYPLERLDYVELDPAVIGLAEKIRGANGIPALRAIPADARRHIAVAGATYDAILMDLEGPSNAQLNRFYSIEFFRSARKALRPGGVLGFSLTGAENYASPEARMLHSSVYRAVSDVFRNVLIIPGQEPHYIASDGPLSLDIAGLIEKRGVDTVYVNAAYLAPRLTPDRLKMAREMVSGEAPVNTDFHPVAYHAHLKYWMSSAGSSFAVPVIALIAIVAALASAIAGSRGRAALLALGTTGFAGMGVEVVLIVAFQALHGYVYRELGLIVTAFLAGIAAGGAWALKRRGDGRALLLRCDLAIAVGCFLLAPALGAWGEVSAGAVGRIAPAVFAGLACLTGFCVGAQFPLAARVAGGRPGDLAGRLYAVDLAGAALGALSAGAFAIPILGITGTLSLIGGVKLATALILGLPKTSGEAEPAVRSPAPFFAALFVMAAVGVAVTTEKTLTALYAFTFTPAYEIVVLSLLVIGYMRSAGFTGAAKPFFAHRDFGPTGTGARPLFGIPLIRWIHFLGLSLLAFFPVFRCYFKVPYLFCHVCPRQCVFGLFRPYLVPAALAMNVERRHWCHRQCPVGTLYHCQTIGAGSSWRPPSWLRVIPAAVIVFTAHAYFRLEDDIAAPTRALDDWYTFFFHNDYAVSLIVIAAAAVLLLAGLRLRRGFCVYLCPIGAVTDFVMPKTDRFFAAPEGRADP